jgi:Cu-Zn family superoxide dismutase
MRRIVRSVTSQPLAFMISFGALHFLSLLAVGVLVSPLRSVAQDHSSLDVPLLNAKGAKVGNAKIKESRRGIEIALEAQGLPPGKLGFHVHEKGDCAAPGFESAGDHFNPTQAQHGKKSDHGPHLGDLGNVDVKKDGTLKSRVKSKELTLNAGANSLRKPGGTALVIHAQPDDERSQPAGGAGDRIVCGVIPGGSSS